MASTLCRERDYYGCAVPWQRDWIDSCYPESMWVEMGHLRRRMAAWLLRSATPAEAWRAHGRPLAMARMIYFGGASRERRMLAFADALAHVLDCGGIADEAAPGMRTTTWRMKAVEARAVWAHLAWARAEASGLEAVRLPSHDHIDVRQGHAWSGDGWWAVNAALCAARGEVGALDAIPHHLRRVACDALRRHFPVPPDVSIEARRAALAAARGEGSDA